MKIIKPETFLLVNQDSILLLSVQPLHHYGTLFWFNLCENPDFDLRNLTIWLIIDNSIKNISIWSMDLIFETDGHL